jgi:Mrp family chromosome partitioning ATPase
MVKILFLSEQDGLGATTLAVNFAQMAAKDGDRVLLIEANRSNPVLASLISPNVHVDLIDLMGVERIICHLRKDLSIIPILDEETSDILGDRAQRCIEGLAGNFDLVVIDGGTFNDQDDELLEMADAVNRVFHLTPEGIEMKANINSSKIKR